MASRPIKGWEFGKGIKAKPFYKSKEQGIVTQLYALYDL